MQTERRQFARATVEWPVTMLTAQGPIEGEIRNISLGGAFVYCQDQPTAGETFRIVIRIPHQRQVLRATARTAWSSIYEPDEVKNVPGIGIRFVEISEPDRQYLREVVSDYQKEQSQ